MYQESVELSPIEDFQIKQKEPQRSVLINPFSKREIRIIPIPVKELHWKYKKGLDILSYEKDRGRQYEVRCFNEISRQEKGQKGTLLLGPRLIDELFTKGISLGGQPDAIRFKVTPDSMLEITDLYEFKSVWDISERVPGKLKGFSQMLSDIREHPQVIPGILNSSMPYLEKKFPERFVVPPDNQISVTFVSTPSREVVIFEAGEHNFHAVHNVRIGLGKIGSWSSKSVKA